MKVVRSKKAKKLFYYLALGSLLMSFANPMTVYAEEEVLYTETNDDYTQEDATETNEVEASVTNDSNLSTASSTDTNDEPQNGDVLYEQGGPREYGEDEFIDADNWSPELDIDPTAGDEIPESARDEVDTKIPSTPTPNPEPTPTPNPDPTPTPNPTPTPTPTPVPKTGDDYGRYFILGALLPALGAIAISIKKELSKAAAIADNCVEETDVHQVVASKKKFVKNSNIKKLK